MSTVNITWFLEIRGNFVFQEYTVIAKQVAIQSYGLIIVEGGSQNKNKNILYKIIKNWRKRFNGGNMKHPFNGKVRFYHVCKYSEFKKVSVSLRKLKHLSSWARNVVTYLTGTLTDKETDYGLRKICTVEPAASNQRFKWRVSPPWNACVQVENGNSIRIYRDL